MGSFIPTKPMRPVRSFFPFMGLDPRLRERLVKNLRGSSAVVLRPKSEAPALETADSN